MVALACVAASGRLLAAGFILGSLIWLLCLRARPTARAWWIIWSRLTVRVLFSPSSTLPSESPTSSASTPPASAAAVVGTS